MKRPLTIFLVCTQLLWILFSCADYGSRIARLHEQVKQLEEECNVLTDNADVLQKLIAAQLSGDALADFEPIAEDGEVKGFRLVFEKAGELTVYNQPAGIAVGEENGRYYWMCAGEWLRDAAGNRIEIGRQTPLPQFRAANGRLQVSTDGGAHWQDLGQVDKTLIESVYEDAAHVVFTLGGGAVISLAKQQAMSLTLSGDDTGISAGEVVTVAYSIAGGGDAASVNVLCDDGWTAIVNEETAQSGSISIIAPDPVSGGKVIVLASDGKGRLVAVEMRLKIESGDTPDGEQPVQQTVLVPVRRAYSVPCGQTRLVLPLIANTDYEVATDADWIHYAGTKAVRTDSVIVNIDANAGRARAGEVTFTAGNYSTSVSIVQDAFVRYINFSRRNFSFESGGGVAEFSVHSNVEYSSEVQADWLKLEELREEGGRRDFAVSCAAHTGTSERSGTIVFTAEGLEPQSVSITQAKYVGPTPDPVIVPSKRTLEVGAEGGIVEMPVMTNTSYSVTVNAGWAAYLGTRAVTTDNLRFSVEPNTSAERAATVYLRSGNLTSTFVIHQARGYRPPQNLPTLVSYIMPCCRAYNSGTTFLVNGSWTMNHSYSDISQVRDILQKIKDAGINVICIDFSNASQWDSYGESAAHSGDGGEFWYQFGSMIDVIAQVCQEKDMKYFFLIGNITTAGGIAYWNGIAKRIWDNWAQTSSYQRYGYGDDRPLLICFLPGTTYAATLRRAAAANKDYLERFRVGTCQINSAISPTPTDGWGYRNFSESSDGKVRFACPNGGVPPQDWYRINADLWQRRMNWVLEAKEYAIIGSYDDTCDGIFWGIANVRQSTSAFHKNSETEGDPFVYYNIVRKTILGID